MRAWELFVEGGWDTKATQSTVIKPSTVKLALKTMDQFTNDFNSFLGAKGIPPIKVGTPTGSSAYHDVDTEDKIYGDIDLQIIVPETEETQGKTTAQAQSYWHGLSDEFVKTKKPNYVHPDSTAGHPILSVGKDQWVQVDLMPHTEKLAKWGSARVIPERGVKGLLHGNMFSVLGELLTMSIQHSGVQFKVRDNVKQPYTTTRKDYQLITVTTEPETFVLDIFNHLAELQNIQDPQVDPLLQQHPGKDLKDVKIANLTNAVKGLAKSFATNDMYGKGDLTKYSSEEDFISAFKQLYTAKAEKDINAAKRDKAETPEAKARAEDDRKKVADGLKMVMGLF